ncbi:processed acidic surface protein [Ectobacillus ponti]|uniref:Processed acidic surface protein n=1 Tax=Ectobacillus ponti TaxID=2961894 RepID=A0AA41X6M7_9BACI|nr:processed acidic surface protein [Ectobacillus ponti]MCP8969906.1 processed acidic surface protein [Ectobacillus ponti]
MRKKWLLFIIAGLLLLPVSAQAAIPPADLAAYTEEIGWPEWVLDLYISYKSGEKRDLQSFNSIAELEKYLGPRLTDEQAFQAMLNRNGLTRNQLNDLLAKNDTSLSDYTFVQELEDDLPLLFADGKAGTENGGKLPNTAGNYAVYALAGALIMLGGAAFLYGGWRRRAS